MKLKELKVKLMEFDEPTIYCDMDGVLADFRKFTDNLIQGNFSDENWNKLPVDTFAQLDPMPDASELWSFISQYEPYILTAYPKLKRGDISKQAPEDKRKWMKQHFGVSPNRVFTVLRQDKRRFAKDGRDGRPNLLIDDHEGNIVEFKRAGFIGILHRNARDTIKQLKALGYK